ncbi:hypothetical protein CPB86DRAFT_803756 [Serendipita vermifera]|nr:hypothetical protein CPB86DRAFT_803756 [Serendipita vermifera]
MQRVRVYERTAADGPRTIVLHDAQPREIHPADPEQNETPEDNELPNDDSTPPRLVLNLQGGGSLRKKKKPGQRVVWKEDVIDNEGSGKKKSKICCIYHKPRRFDESSDESSDGSDCERDPNHNHSSSGGLAVASTSATVTVATPSRYEPNAYEIQPRHRPDPSH